MKITLVTRVLNDEGRIISAYSRYVKLPFTPSIGMKLKLNASESLWKTEDGQELDPPMKEIVYNLDDDEMYCLFDIDKLLTSKYWTQISNIDKSHELKQFELHTGNGEIQVTHHENQGKHAIRTLFYYITPAIVLGYNFFAEFIECII